MNIFSGWKSTGLFASGFGPVTIRTLLKYHYSLSSLPSQEQLIFFGKGCTDPEEAEEIMELGANYQAYQIWRQDEPRLVDVFKQFPSIMVNSAELIHILPPQLPR